MRDLNGTNIEVGDRVVFATRVGDHAVLKEGTVTALMPADKSRDNRLSVQVEGQSRPSTISLHGSYHGPKVVVL